MPHPKKTSLPERVGIREVLDLSWPIMVSMLSYTVMGVVDTLFVGRLGTAPLAAVGGWRLPRAVRRLRQLRWGGAVAVLRRV